jgi:hypothetical protein
LSVKISIRCIFNIYTDHFYLFLKVILIAFGSFLHARAIIIYGVDAIVQELCDLGTVVDAETDEGKDTNGRAELSVLLYVQLGIGRQALLKNYKLRRNKININLA